MARFDLNLITSLDALLREKNVTTAADKIGVSQPAMSGMLKRLRDQLQDPILVRVGTQYELSGRAQELVEPVRQALLMIEDLTRPSSSFEVKDADRHIRIMASEFSQMMILPELFHRAMTEAPKLTFEVLPIYDPVARVYHGDVDICLTGAPLSEVPAPAAGLIRAQTIMVEGFVAVVDMNHPLSDTATIEELSAYPHVETLFPGLSVSVERSITFDQAAHRAPKITVPSFLGVPPMLINTDRICLIPEMFFELVSASWNLRSIKLPDDYNKISLRTLWHMRHDMDPLHRWLRAVLQQTAGGLDKSYRLAEGSQHSIIETL
jgi:LysR family transcriptional regulator, nod-box dependent transcriptional activator